MRSDVGFEHPRGLLTVADVELQDAGISAGITHTCCGGFSTGQISHAMHHNVVAVSGKTQRNRSADAAAGTCNQHRTHSPSPSERRCSLSTRTCSGD